VPGGKDGPAGRKNSRGGSCPLLPAPMLTRASKDILYHVQLAVQ